MKIFLCWLINVCDWVGVLSMAYMLVAIAPHQPTNSTFVNQLIPTDPHFALFGAMLAIIPAIVTAVYATLNYNLILSWAVIRRMSPLNIISSIFFSKH